MFTKKTQEGRKEQATMGQFEQKYIIKKI